MGDSSASKSVPRGRVSRLSQFGRLAGGIAGGMTAEAARRIASGDRPRMRDLILTPGNAKRLADRLSHLRGAAMKLGQMISMDAGDMLPPELADILSRVREQAYRMPPSQLKRVLDAEWGRDWRNRFRHFEAGPIAAASIGQVHRATSKDGRELAIKVQYPGVAQSIDSDVDNVATLLRVSGLLPGTLDISPLLDAAKDQLREEADYLREGNQMRRFRSLLDGRENYVVPELAEDFTTANVLAMSYESGAPIETLTNASQQERDEAIEMLLTLVLDEMFVFGVMQTDPNFGNYRWRTDTRQLVLLDFGAAREIAPGLAEGYADLLKAGLADDRDRVREAAVAAGFLGEHAVDKYQVLVDRMIDVVLREANRDEPFDFGDRAFVGVLREQGVEMASDRSTWHIPSPELLFVQRKISGTALLASRLQAKVNLREMVAARLSV